MNETTLDLLKWLQILTFQGERRWGGHRAPSSPGTHPTDDRVIPCENFLYVFEMPDSVLRRQPASSLSLPLGGHDPRHLAAR